MSMTEKEAIEYGYVEIKGYENLYMINPRGDIFGIKRGRVLKHVVGNNGYMQINLSKDGNRKSYKIHRLVAETFIRNPLNLTEVNHKDENKKNNCVDNLEWCTREYNISYNDAQYRRAKNRNYEEISKKRSAAQSKEVVQYDYDGTIIAVWKNAYVAAQHGYDRSIINQCCLGNKKSHKGYLWKYGDYIEKQIPKKPIRKIAYDGEEGECCPACGLDNSEFGYNCCVDCGQRLDWGE